MNRTLDMVASRFRGSLRSAALIATAGALAVLSVPADAALIASMSFTAPTGTAGPNDPIDVYLTITLDAASDALATNEYGQITSGVTADDYGVLGIDPADVSSAYLNVFFECSGNFTASCINPPPYSFDFASDLIVPANLDIQAGTSAQFLFGTFTPSGPVAAGTYTFFNAGLTATPLDADGNFFPNEYDNPRSLTLLQTCTGENPDCAFTRTVEGVESAVPEPATWAMMLSGFGAIGYSLRRRRVSTMRQAV